MKQTCKEAKLRSVIVPHFSTSQRCVATFHLSFSTLQNTDV